MRAFNHLSKLLALEAAVELPHLWEKHPQGITIKVLQAHMGWKYEHAHCVVAELHGMKKAKFITRPDRRCGYLVPLDWDEPIFDLTTKQQATLTFLLSRADKYGYVQASMRDIIRGAVLAAGGVIAHLDSLERKKYLRFVDRGSHHRKTLFQVFPNGDAVGPSMWPRSMEVRTAIAQSDRSTAADSSVAPPSPDRSR